MAIVQSLGQLTRTRTWKSVQYGGVRSYSGYNLAYAELYRLQPNVRVCVDFLARNIAQTGIHVYRRVSDTDRVRVLDHPFARLLKNPLPPQYKITNYRFIEDLVSDLGIYSNAYVRKVRGDGGRVEGLLRLPPTAVVCVGNLLISHYEVTINGEMKEVAAEDIIHIRGYNPDDPLTGVSPLETLRRVLAEEHAAGVYREGFWKNAARMNGIINRPANSPQWSDAARARFLAEFEELYAGDANSAKTAVLEEGMTWESITFSAQQAEYLAGRKLTREECARQYHIPLPFVGILDNATFSNISEQHKNLYQDTLGPWFAWIVADLELQLLPDFTDTEGIYLEFNIQSKLAGAFDDQVKSMQSAVGRPWMTANEARARLNMPSLGGDADQLITPLNVTIGGLASPNDTAGKAAHGAIGRKAQQFGAEHPQLRERHEEEWRKALAKHYRRQEAAISSRVKGMGMGQKLDIGGVWWDTERWNSELYADLLALNIMTAHAWAELMASEIGSEVSLAAMQAWLEEHSRIQAENINDYTRTQVEEAIKQPEPRDAVQSLFLSAATIWAVRQALTAVTTAMNFGRHEAARAGGLANKTWNTTSRDPRDSHKRMNGETVPVRDRFSNGLMWPGDPRGSAEDNANCHCSVTFS